MNIILSIAFGMFLYYLLFDRGFRCELKRLILKTGFMFKKKK